MINTQVIEHIIRLAIFSTAVKGETPVSIMLLARAESGKTEVLKKFAFIGSVKYTTEFNTSVFTDFAMEHQMGNKRTIMIPDFLRVTKRKYSTQANSLTILNAITEEGWSGKLPMGQMINKPIKANLITSLTQEEVEDKRHKWAQIGFLSRFIPITFSYDEDTNTLIRSYIKDRIYQNDGQYSFEVPKEPIDILLPKEISNEIEKITFEVIQDMGGQLKGFRLQRQLQVLAMASALSSGRMMVSEDDIKMLKVIKKHINFAFNSL